MHVGSVGFGISTAPQKSRWGWMQSQSQTSPGSISVDSVIKDVRVKEDLRDGLACVKRVKDIVGD